MDVESYLLGKKAGGGSGTSNYNDLSNKPSINGVTLSGDKSTSDLGIQIPTVPTNVSAFTNDAGYINDVSGKQDTLVSGTNIKTINNESILGSGNIEISGGGGAETKIYWLNLNNIPTGVTVTDETILKTFDDMLADYKAGNVVLLENRLSASNNVRELYIASNSYISSSTQEEYLSFDEITREFINSTNQDIYRGYTTSNLQYSQFSFNYTTKQKSGSIASYGKICFLDPTKTYSVTFKPTQNYHPSTKLYTDKTHYENMAGYDATKTQVLKNVNGTLTWVDE